MSIKIQNKFEFGQLVFLVTDSEQEQRMVTGIVVTPNGILYRLACGIDQSDHYECEISESKNVI